MQSFVAWARYGRRYDQLTAEEMVFVDSLITRFRQGPVGHTFPSGFNPAVNHMSFTLDEVKVAHVPLFVYALNALVHLVAGEYSTMRPSGIIRATSHRPTRPSAHCADGSALSPPLPSSPRPF